MRVAEARLGVAGERFRIVGGGEVSRLQARDPRSSPQLESEGEAKAIEAALLRLDAALRRPTAAVKGARPRLTAAQAPLTREIAVRDEFGATRTISIPAERALTVFVDKRELVTLMTLGAAPELLVLGYLRNQRLVDRCATSTRSPSTGTSTPPPSRRAPASSASTRRPPSASSPPAAARARSSAS